MLANKCKFNTVKRILLSLNTSWDKIAVEKGTHWMLAELDLATDAVIIYDWLTVRDQDVYDKITGVLSVFCSVSIYPCPSISSNVCFLLCGYFHLLWFSKVLHISHSILDTSASAPLQTLLTSMHTHCSGLCETHSTSPAKESVVRMDVQQNGHDCGVWSLYALYSSLEEGNKATTSTHLPGHGYALSCGHIVF